MPKAVGIDLGTTNSVIAVMEGGEPVVIPNSEGSRTTPSVMAFTKSGERLGGQAAGFNFPRLIHEPPAASLAYGLNKKENETILVFDLGGGTFDVSILDVGDGVFQVKATNGDTLLGGDDYDRRIVDWLAEEFKKSNGIDLKTDRQALPRLTQASERAQIELSSP